MDRTKIGLPLAGRGFEIVPDPGNPNLDEIKKSYRDRASTKRPRLTFRVKQRHQQRSYQLIWIPVKLGESTDKRVQLTGRIVVSPRAWYWKFKAPAPLDTFHADFRHTKSEGWLRFN